MELGPWAECEPPLRFLLIGEAWNTVALWINIYEFNRWWVRSWVGSVSGDEGHLFLPIASPGFFRPQKGGWLHACQLATWSSLVSFTLAICATNRSFRPTDVPHRTKVLLEISASWRMGAWPTICKVFFADTRPVQHGTRPSFEHASPTLDFRWQYYWLWTKRKEACGSIITWLATQKSSQC